MGQSPLPRPRRLSINLTPFDAIEKKISKSPEFLPPWIPILQMYAPALYQQARNALDLSKTLVKQWLAEYMFAAEPKKKRARLAAGIARYLSDHNKFKSHGRGLCPDDFRKIPALASVKVRDLGEMPDLQNQVQGLYHAISLTFGSTAAVKIFENTEGKALIRLQRFAMPIPLMRQQPMLQEVPAEQNPEPQPKLTEGNEGDGSPAS